MKKIILLPLLLACSASNTEEANPCATAGATYLEDMTELSGNCGPIPEVIINVNSDDTLTSSVSISCQSTSQDGCTARDTNCTFSNNGLDCSETFETSFAQDGSSASGVLTLTCTENGQSCVSTYATSFVRQ